MRQLNIQNNELKDKIEDQMKIIQDQDNKIRIIQEQKHESIKIYLKYKQ